MDDKAQISLEMLLLAAALIAVAVLFLSGVRTSSKSFQSKMTANSKQALSKLGQIK